MAIKQAGWEPFIEGLQDSLKELFQSTVPDVIANAEENPSELLELTTEQKEEVIAASDQAIDDTIEKTVDDINEEIGEEGSEVSEETSNDAKIISAFFLTEAVRRAMHRVHTAKIARQIPDDERDIELESAITKGNTDIDVVSQSELSTTYEESSVEQATSKGFECYQWIHVTSPPNHRQTHLARDGQIFRYDTPPADGHPGTLFNCNCIMSPVACPDTLNMDRTIMNMKQCFNLSQEKETAHLWIKGPIGMIDWFSDEGVLFNEFKSLIDLVLDKKIIIHVDSPGGLIFDGISIFNYIKSLESDIEIHIEGMAGSIASLLPLSVDMDKRFVNTGAMVGIHLPWACLCGNQNEFRTGADNLESMGDSLVAVYVEKTNLSESQARDFMSAEKMFTTDQVIEFGFAGHRVDDVVTPDIEGAKAFIAEMKACQVEQKDVSNFAVNLSQISLTDTRTNSMSRETELQEQLDQAKSDLNVATAAKDLLETENTNLTATNTQLTTDLETANNSIASAQEDANKNAEKLMGEADEVRAKAQTKGFKAEGFTPEDVMRSVIEESGVKKPEGFEGEALDNIFNFVLDHKKGDDSDVDGAFIGGDPSDDELELPGKRGKT
jgi:ATP-dependent Clp protease protease subunit